MQTTPHLSRDQRVVLAELLQSRLLGFKRERASQLDGLSQAESARQTLLQDANDARQRAGEHEVKGIVSDIESGEFNEIQNALQRIHGADYGLCIDCHTAIPFKRLQLEPQTLRCIACQNLHEQNA
jgi:DnaK suppressor protein